MSTIDSIKSKIFFVILHTPTVIVMWWFATLAPGAATFTAGVLCSMTHNYSACSVSGREQESGSYERIQKERKEREEEEKHQKELEKAKQQRKAELRKREIERQRHAGSSHCLLYEGEDRSPFDDIPEQNDDAAARL